MEPLAAIIASLPVAGPAPRVSVESLVEWGVKEAVAHRIVRQNPPEEVRRWKEQAGKKQNPPAYFVWLAKNLGRFEEPAVDPREAAVQRYAEGLVGERWTETPRDYLHEEDALMDAIRADLDSCGPVPFYGEER